MKETITINKLSGVQKFLGSLVNDNPKANILFVYKTRRNIDRIKDQLTIVQDTVREFQEKCSTEGGVVVITNEKIDGIEPVVSGPNEDNTKTVYRYEFNDKTEFENTGLTKDSDIVESMSDSNSVIFWEDSKKLDEEINELFESEVDIEFDKYSTKELENIEADSTVPYEILQFVIQE